MNVTLGGFRIRVSDYVQPVPRIQVRDIKYKDGTSILSQKFLTEINTSLAAEWGYMNVAYMMSGPFGKSIVMNSQQLGVLLKDYTP